MNELCLNFENKAVAKLTKIAEVFDKNHYHILRNVNDLLSADDSLKREFIPITYKSNRGKNEPTYLVSREGFFLLVSSFKGKKALQFKRQFYKQYEMMEKEIQRLQSENKLLTEFARTVFNLEYNPKVDSIDKTAILQEIQRLQSENITHNNYLKLLNEYTNSTYCITDLCCKFEGLDAVTANEVLVKRGVIVKRASGYYPSLDYDGSSMLVSATCLAYNGFVNYVRYTPTGIEHLVDLFSKLGYKLKEV